MLAPDETTTLRAELALARQQIELLQMEVEFLRNRKVIHVVNSDESMSDNSLATRPD